MTRSVLVSAYPFTAADATAVSSLNGGADWTEQNASTAQLRVISNGFKSSGNDADCCTKTAGFTTDQYFSMKILGGPFNNGDAIGGSVLNNGGAFGAFSCYRVYYYDNIGAQGCQVDKFVNGTSTITAIGGAIAGAFVTGDTLECECTTSGGVVTFNIFKNGVSIGTRTTSTSILTTGKPGIYAFAAAATLRGDDWEAGNVTATVAGPPVLYRRGPTFVNDDLILI